MAFKHIILDGYNGGNSFLSKTTGLILDYNVHP